MSWWRRLFPVLPGLVIAALWHAAPAQELGGGANLNLSNTTAGARQNIGAAQADVRLRTPIQTDDAAHGYPAGSFWLDQLNRAWVQLRSTANNAVWSRAHLNGSTVTPLDDGDICDIATTVFCGGTTQLKSGATNLFELTRLSDGTASTIALANGQPDYAAADKFRAGTRVAVSKIIDQGGTGDIVPIVTPLTTDATTSAGTPMHFADTTGVTVDMLLELEGCYGQYVLSLTGTTVTLSGGGCAVNSGTKVMFRKAPTFDKNMIGAARSIIADQTADWSGSTVPVQIRLPDTVTGNQNAKTIIIAGRVQQQDRGVSLYSLWSSGTGSAGEDLSCSNGNTRLHHENPDNTTYSDDAYAGARGLCSTSPFIFWTIGANGSVTAAIDETSFITAGHNIGNSTFTGGSLCAATVSAVSTYRGGCEITAVVVFSRALTTSELNLAIARLIRRQQIPVQVRDPNVIIAAADSLAQGPKNYALRNWVRQMSELYPGWRIFSNGFTSQTIAHFVTNYTAEIGNQINANARNNVLFTMGSQNDFATVTQPTTNGSTAAGNNILHFANTASFTPGAVAVGQFIGNDTAGSTIPVGTKVTAFDGTTVTMSQNATGAGVASGNTIRFGSTESGLEASHTSLWTNIKATCAAKPTTQCTIVTATTPISTSYSTAQQGWMAAVNAWLVANAAANGAVLVDLAGDPQFASWSGTAALSPDGFHWSEIMNAYPAQIIGAAIAANLKLGG